MRLDSQHLAELGLHAAINSSKRARGTEDIVAEVGATMGMVGTATKPLCPRSGGRFLLCLTPIHIVRSRPGRSQGKQKRHGHEEPQEPPITAPGRELESHDQAGHVADPSAGDSDDELRMWWR